MIGWLLAVPTRLKIYAGVGIIIVLALLRWRSAGITAAVEELKRKDRENARQIRHNAMVARSRYPDGDDDVLERLRKSGRLRDDG